MRYDWSALKDELGEWRAQRIVLPLWWRDDDAIEPTDRLARLGELSASLDLAVHLAVVPKFATKDLADLCKDRSNFPVLVHGWAHENRALPTEKKSEFGRERDGARDELANGLAWMEGLFGAGLGRIFVPPWNRISDGLIAELAEVGYDAVSTFTPRAARMAAPGLVQINTHVDPIFWRGGRGLAPPEQIIEGLVQTLRARRRGESDAAEPLGFLTHHLVHDADIWDFTERCLGVLLEGGAAPVNLLELRGNLP
jgi:hypothetical protein